MYLMAEIDWAYTLDLLFKIAKVAAGLSFVVFVHELGHFLVAKACGVKCEKFYVGFDVPLKFGPISLPSKLAHFQWGETEYGIGILPLGGYVKMLGQDDDPRNAQAEAERIRVQNETSDEGEAELDPRSFPAKPVPHRMAIISAGVIMNLIFAVLFATYAFTAGAPYTPTEIGATVPGGPAWEAGLTPGSRVIQIGENGPRSESLRFDWDLSQRGVGLAQDNEDVPLLVRTPDGDEEWVRIRPVMTQKRKARIPMIGVAPGRAMTIGLLLPGNTAEQAQPELKAGDRIVAIAGTSVETARDVDRMFAANVDQPISITVERTTGKKDQKKVETIESTIPPNPLRRLGVILRHGPVTGIRPGSPAEEAGFRRGDLIVKIDGEEISDPVMLPGWLRSHYGASVTVEVLRDGEPLELAVTPRVPQTFEWTVSSNFPMGVETLGLAYEVTLDVEGTTGIAQEEGSLQPGDILTGVAFRSSDPEKPTDELLNEGKPLDLAEEGFDWMFVFGQIQYLGDDAFVQLFYERDGIEKMVELKPFDSEYFNPDRGILFNSKEEVYTAPTLAIALQRGALQTWEDATLVARLVKKLATGQMSFTNLGGPLSIVTVAGSEASKGLPTFLLFLTFLSANLAILNFLPIPALDGGHMVFLVAEGIRGKPVDERLQFALTLAGVACLLGLMIFVFGLDIHRLFG